MSSPRSTHRPRRAPLAAGALCALALLAAARTTLAQTHRGALVVLGLRAPNGDDEAASNLTSALRRAARTAGFEVPDNTPALDQSMAAFGCDESVPADCLAQIAGDLHAQRMVFGEVRHHGRGPTAQLEMNVTLYDNATHVISTHDSATSPRAMGQDTEALNPIARRMLDTLLPPPAEAPAAVNPVSDAHHVAPHVEAPPAGPPVPVRRYVGIGAIAVGVVGVGVGLLAFGLPWLQLDGMLNQGGLDPNNIPAMSAPNNQQAAWFWQSYMNGNRDGGMICAAAQMSNAGPSLTHPPDHSEPATSMFATNNLNQWQITNARPYCAQSASLQTGEWAFVVGGAVLTVLGIVLVATDSTGAHPATDAHAHRATAPSIAVVPTISPGYSGATFALRF